MASLLSFGASSPRHQLLVPSYGVFHLANSLLRIPDFPPRCPLLVNCLGFGQFLFPHSPSVGPIHDGITVNFPLSSLEPREQGSVVDSPLAIHPALDLSGLEARVKLVSQLESAYLKMN